ARVPRAPPTISWIILCLTARDNRLRSPPPSCSSLILRPLPVSSGGAGHGVQRRRTQPAAVDREVVLQRVGPPPRSAWARPEVTLREAALPGVALGDE